MIVRNQLNHNVISAAFEIIQKNDSKGPRTKTTKHCREQQQQQQFKRVAMRYLMRASDSLTTIFSNRKQNTNMPFFIITFYKIKILIYCHLKETLPPSLSSSLLLLY